MFSWVRNPKEADELLSNAMKLHVIGVIFHGTPDDVHLFSAAPHLAGNSNLNCETLYRALKAQYSEHGMLPRLHVQVRCLDGCCTHVTHHWLCAFCVSFSFCVCHRWTMPLTTKAGGVLASLRG